MISSDSENKLKNIICELHYLADIENAPALDGLAFDLEVEYMYLIND